MDCSICMSSPVFAVQLKCKHIFCYLCVKGVANSLNRKCPLCRKTIPKNVLKRPKFVRNVLKSDRPLDAFNTYQWFYAGKGGTGYWAYDHINGQIIEQAFNSDQKMCEITISGVVYCIDFIRQIQYRKDQTFRSRRIRRDLLSNVSVKGIAGVSKYLVRDLFGNIQLDPSSGQSSNSGQQNGVNTDNNSIAINCETDDQIVKKMKVEIKSEPDSTTDD